MWLKTPQAETQ